MDAALAYDDATGDLDIAIERGDLARADGVTSAALVSLFSDRLADIDDALPNNAGDRRGWWGDNYTHAGRLGSKLWLVAREKMTRELPGRIEDYARQSLQWLIDDGDIDAVQVQATVLRADAIGLQIALVGETIEDTPTASTTGVTLIDGLNVQILLRLFARLDDVYFSEFEG